MWCLSSEGSATPGAAAGTVLLGHFAGVEDSRARFAADLGESVAWGDERCRELMVLVRRVALERGLPEPDIPEPEPFVGEAPTELQLSGFGAAGFRGRMPSTRSASPSSATARAASYPACSSWAPTSCAPASRRSWWASARMPRSSPGRSPRVLSAERAEGGSTPQVFELLFEHAFEGPAVTRRWVLFL